MSTDSPAQTKTQEPHQEAAHHTAVGCLGTEVPVEKKHRGACGEEH